MAKHISIIIPLAVITLCCLALVEGGYTAFEYLVLRPKIGVTAPPSEVAPVLVPSKLAIDKKNCSQIIVARNLFAASTNAASNPATAADNFDTLEATSLGIVLMGTIEDNDGGNRLIVLDKKTMEQKIYRQGDTVQEAIIKEIRRGKAVLSLHGRDEILDMSEAAKLRPVQNVTTDKQAQALPQDMVPAVVETNVLEQPLSGIPFQQGPPPMQPAEAEQSANKVVAPAIIRPVQSPESN